MRIDEWYSGWRMVDNLSITKTLVVPCSQTATSRFIVNIVKTVVPVEDSHLDFFGVTFGGKLTFECHLKIVEKSADQRIGIIGRACRFFG